ncbi:hypothetical protein D7X75_15605 [Corallococcus sp. CA031C]|nr:hypothetical protein D7X75_15605 [Corallococcus sp. CA031C]
MGDGLEAPLDESLENGLARPRQLLRNLQRMGTVLGPPVSTVHRGHQLANERTCSTFLEHTLRHLPEEFHVLSLDALLWSGVKREETKNELKLRRLSLGEALQQHDEQWPLPWLAKFRCALFDHPLSQGNERPEQIGASAQLQEALLLCALLLCCSVFAGFCL